MGYAFVGAPVYRFRVAQDRPFDSGQSLHLMQTLLARGRLAFQIIARPAGIGWQVVDLSPDPRSLGGLKAHNVAVKTTHLAAARQCRYPFYRGKLSYTTYAIANRPLMYVGDMREGNDPLIQLAQTASFLQEGEEIRYTVIVNRPHKPTLYRGLQLAGDMLNSGGNDRYGEVIAHKQRQPWYECLVLLDVESRIFDRVFTLRQAVDLQLSGGFDRNQANHPLNGLRSRRYPRIFQVNNPQAFYPTSSIGWYDRSFQHTEIAEWWDNHWLYLEAAELATLWHLPHQGFAGTNAYWLQPRPALPRPLAMSQTGIALGQAHFQDTRSIAHLHPDDRTTHLNIVGRNGVGKSTLMYHMICQDIAAGEGVVVIDPHGALVKSILRGGIPARREADVVVLDLGQTDYPLPLNVFAGTQSYAAIGRIVDSIERLYENTGVRMDKYLRAGVKALAHVPQATMKDVYYLLTSAEFRAGVLAHITDDDETYQTLHDDYHLIGAGQQRAIRGPILNRISPFYANDYLYPSLCHPDRLDFARLIAERKVILVSLGVSGEKVPKKERDLVGALLISLLQMLGMDPDRDPIPCYVYIDEVQNFVTSALETVFSEARKYRLAMTVAHQHFHQLSSETFHAIMGNVGTTVVFRTNVDDAQKLAPYTQPQFGVSELVKLDKYRAAVKTQLQGETQDAFLLMPAPPPREPAGAVDRELRLRELSAVHYTPQTRQMVTAWLQQRYGGASSPPPPPVDVPPDDDRPAGDGDLDYDAFAE